MRVRDNGMGLSAEMLARVFDLFTQADRSLDRSQGGLGIGLTLVRSLVELHDGSVSAESRGPGQGSEFIVRLPVAGQARPLPGRDEAASSGGESAQQPLRLLVVDDSQDSAQSLAQVLRLWGYEVAVAHDGPAAITAASVDLLDMILLDIGLPGMDGYQVAREIRHKFGKARPMLVALTGYGQEEDLARSRNAGFDDHLVKPVSWSRLRELLTAPHVLPREGGQRQARAQAQPGNSM